MRLHSWEHTVPPGLGDFVHEIPEPLCRGFLVVGVEETRDPTVFRLTMERIRWSEFVEARDAGATWWSFVRDRR